MPPLPTGEEAFGLPTADEAFGPPAREMPLTGPGFDQYFSDPTTGGNRILDEFGQGFRQQWGNQPLGLSPETEALAKRLGLFPDLEKHNETLARDFNAAVMRPAAIALDVAMRGPMALYHGIGDVAEAAGVPRDIIALPEAFPTGRTPAHVAPLAAPFAADLAKARELGVIGRGEAGWLGVTAMAPEAASREAIARLTPGGGATELRIAPSEPPAPDIHALARQIAPDTFQEYDALAQQKQVSRGLIDQVREEARQSPEAVAEQQKIDALLGRVGGIEGRLTNRQLDQLNDARDRLDAIIDDAPAQTRRDLMAADERMRDLAPAVSDAYAQAAARLPETQPATEPAAAPEAISATPPTAPAAEAAPAPPAAPALPLHEPPAALPIAKGTAEDIAADVRRQLTRAGRPSDEAAANAAIVAAHYEARAQRFGGALGSPFDLYQRDGAAIRGREQGGPQGQAAGRTTLTKDGRTIVTLFRRADASTFIHETGHQWLAELLSDAEHPQAPQELKDDAATVRNWLGAGKEPTRAQHEQFARGFEAYMMEGRAPSPALGGIFAQFRQWLLQLYRGVAETKLPIIDSVRGVYDRLVGTPEKVAIAPDRDLPFGYDEAHARAAEETAPEQAASVADNMRAERDHVATIDLTEAEDAERRREAGRNPPGGSLPDGQGAGSYPAAGEARGVPAAGTLGPGRGEIASEGGTDQALAYRIRRRPDETAYVEVPPEPVRLAQFLRKAGGIREDAGELRQIGANRRPGLVNRNGLPLDEATLQAWEAGYLPGEDRPEIGVLLEHLERDLGGLPVYSQGDAAAAARHRQAMDRNNEIDALAQKIGVNPLDWTREQFFNMVAGHEEGETLKEAQRSLGDALQAEYEEAERRAKEWAESRGDAWEPERPPEPRTEEDLDNEKQGNARPPAPAGAAGARSAGAAAGDRQALPGRGGQGRGAGRARGGAGASIVEPTEPPGQSGQRFERGATSLVDKAGNIRLDNLNQPDDIDQAIRDAAARNDEFRPERRGTLSDGEVLDLAEALGKDPAFLDRKRIGDAFNAEEVLAARHLLIRSASAVCDAMIAARDGAQAAVMALAQAIAKHEMIQGKVAQATAEWGRAGRSFRMLMEGQPATDELDAFLREYSGRTLYQIKEMAKLGAELQNPAQISKFVADTSGGKINRAVVYYWENTLLSGPVTHLRYSVGNAVNALWQPLVETPIAATADAIFRNGAPDQVRFGEVGAELYGLMKGARDGWYAAAKSWKYGVAPTLPGEHVPARMVDTSLLNPLRDVGVPAPIANAIGIPGRAVTAIHAFFKQIRYEQNIQSLAYRQAAGEGLRGDAFAARVAELTTSPSDAMMAEAVPNALKELYMAPSDFTSFAGKLQSALNSYDSSNVALAAKIIVPFLKVGGQITRNAFVERTILGLASKEVQGRLFSGTAAGTLQAAKITAGMGLIGGMVAMTLEGLATGDGPSDPGERNVWLLNHRPNHIQIGPVTIPYQGLGHLGMLMRFAANMTETAQAWDEKDGAHIAASFFYGLTHAVLDDNFMRGLHEALDAAYNFTEAGPRYLRSFATNWLPFATGAGQIAREIDPYMRQARSVFDDARARMPLVSQTLEPRRDVFGEPIPNGGPLPQYQNDPTVKALADIQHGIGRLDRKIVGVELTPEQYDDYARIAGRLTKMRLDAVTSAPGWNSIPPAMRSELIQKQVERARHDAQETIKIQNFDIVQKANAAKTAKLRGTP